MLITHLINLILLIVSDNIVNALVPRPNKHIVGNAVCRVSEPLSIQHNYSKCFILIQSLEFFNRRLLTRRLLHSPSESEALTINMMNIIIRDGCDESENKLWPREYMNESYKIRILDGKIEIECDEVWGGLHALQTIIQLIHRSQWGSLLIHEQIIEDSPRYIHRGFRVDTARHYISVDEIEKFIDAMAVVKMNVFHWHMTDDTSFPYVSSTYPRLSLKGAYHPQKLVYENSDVVRVIEYARLRGIRVMVEFDTPSHTKSWEKSYPEIRTRCYSGSQSGPFNPTHETTFEFLKAFFKEVTSVFPEPFIHLGGNEVSFHCWRSNPEISNFMKEKQFDDDYGKLEAYYFDRLIEAIQSVQPEGYGVIPVVSHEVFQNGYRPNKTTVIHIWKCKNWPKLAKSITSAGYRVIVSSCWRISPSNHADQWHDYYKCDIGAFGGTEEEQKLVIGGEAIVFGENVDNSDLFMSSWPEGAVIADRLWSHDQSTIIEMKPRLSELRCHMRDLGFNVKPVNEPKSCLQL